MVEAEHAGEKRPVRARELEVQLRFQRVCGPALCIEQRVLAALFADRLDLGFAGLDTCTDTQGVVGMHEVEFGLGRKTEQEIADRAAGSGFARLVGAEHELQVGRAAYEDQPAVGEMTVGEKIELREPHGALSSAARRESR